MVGGAIRHLHSLRLMRRDNGWIHTLLEEAENERMHLLTFIQLRQPGPIFRGTVLVTQGIVFNLFFAGKRCAGSAGALLASTARLRCGRALLLCAREFV
jgi:hypothetical protein